MFWQSYSCTLLIVVLIIPGIKSEILTLSSGNKVTCVLTGNSSYSAVYTQPYDFHSWSIRSIDKIEFNLTEDWNLTSTEEFSFYPVTDYRWQYFPFLSSVKLGRNAQSFSVYTNKRIPSFLSSYNKIRSSFKFLNTPTEYQWVHYTIVPRDDNLYLLLENSTMNNIKLVKKINNEEIMSKYHYYSFFYSSKTNTGITEKYSIFLNNTKCVSMFVSVDKNCFLDIILQSKDQVSKETVEGFNKKDSLKHWIRKEIKINVAENVTLQFIKRRQDGKKTGFWAIDDIYSCKSFDIINSSALFTNNSRNSPYICNELNSTYNNKIDFEFWTEEHSVNLNFSCSEILGKNYPFCENHTICYRHNCHCTWNTTNKMFFCPKICPKGYWGLDCKSKCLQNCEFCDDEKNCSQCIIGYTLLHNLQNNEILCLKIKNFREENSEGKIVVETVDSTDIIQNYDKLEENLSNRVILTTVILGVVFTLLVLFLYLIKFKNLNVIKCFERTTTTEEIPLNSVANMERIITEEIPLISTVEMDPSTAIEKIGFVELLKNKIKNKELEKEFLIVKNKRTNRVCVGDYKNVTYINGYNCRKAYIVCRSPNSNSVTDFCKLIWENNVEFIITATNFIEDEELMRAQYWSKNSRSVEYNSITVKQIKKEKQLEYCYINTLEVSYDNEKRIIEHIQLEWDLHFINLLYPNHFIPVIKEIKKNHENGSYPILIHSRLDINIAGTLILCDMALQMIKIKSNANFYHLTKHLREQGKNIIDTEQYYILAHLIVAEYLEQESNNFTDIFIERIRSGNDISYNEKQLKKQLDHVEKLCDFDKVIQSWSRGQTIYTSNSSFYVDGYKTHKKYFVLTQSNQDDLIKEFCVVLTKTESSTICVFLNQIEQDKWPNAKDSTYKHTYNNVLITLSYTLTIKEDDLYSIRKFVLEFSNKVGEQDITLYQLKEVCINNILNLVCETNFKSSIVVCCNDGVNCGLFLIMSYIIDKYDKEYKIDVCTAIRTARRSGINFIQNFEQLQSLYSCIAEYLKSLERSQLKF